MLFFAGPAVAQVTCIKDRLAELNNQQSFGIAPSEVEDLISQIVRAVGLTPAGIVAVPCTGVAKVRTYNLDEPGIPKLDYILYDPVWTREVIGTNSAVSVKTRDQAVFLFGHELAHLLGRHFTTNADLPPLQQETDADRFGGCAAGVMNAKWENIEELISRIRGNVNTEYPSQSNALAAAAIPLNIPIALERKPAVEWA